MRGTRIAAFCLILLYSAFPTWAADGETVTLRWFMRWDQVRVEKVALPVIEAFERMYPNIKIEFENNGGSASDYWAKLQTMVIGGTAPDILYPATHNGYALAVQGELLDLTPFVQRDGIDMDQYLYDIDELYTHDGKLWALPIDWARVAVFYNEEKFAKAGLGPPPDDWSWHEFLQVARRLTVDLNGDGNFDEFAIRDFTSYWPLMAWSFSGHGLYDDLRRPTRTLINSPGVIEGIDFLANMINQSNVIPTRRNLADWQNVFTNGVAAMEITGHWRIPAFVETLDFDWNIAPLPRGVTSVNRIDGSGFAISRQTEYPNEAWEFVKFLAAPGAYGTQLLLALQQFTPVVREMIESDDFLNPPGMVGINKMALLAGETLYSMYEPLGPMYDALNALVERELDLVWDGEQSAASAAQKLEGTLNARLGELRERYRY